jgi:hypothetical protein
MFISMKGVDKKIITSTFVLTLVTGLLAGSLWLALAYFRDFTPYSTTALFEGCKQPLEWCSHNKAENLRRLFVFIVSGIAIGGSISVAWAWSKQGPTKKTETLVLMMPIIIVFIIIILFSLLGL